MSGLGNQSLTILLFVLVLLSGMFSAIETAYSSSNKIRLRAMDSKGAEGVLRILDDFERFISTVLVGNNIVNILSATMATILFTRIYGNSGAVIATAVMTVAVLLFGEIAPKTIASRNPEKFAISTLGIVQFFETILRPLTLVFGAWQYLVSKLVRVEDYDGDISDELITMVDEAEKEGDLQAHESDLISAAIEFNDLDVKDVLTPRVNVMAVNITTSIKELEKMFRLNSFSRIPVFEKNIDNIVGVIHEKDFYSMLYVDKDRTTIRRLIKPVIYTNENVKISTLLKQLQKAKLHMAVVLDEYGGTAGIITMEDIIEELVGEIYDEHDTVTEFYKQIGDNEFLVNCSAEVDDMMERFGVDYDEDEFDFITVSGWVIHELDKIPQAGEEFDYKNLHVKVTQADQRKVNEIHVTVRETETEE